jgi:hypothetical protein
MTTCRRSSCPRRESRLTPYIAGKRLEPEFDGEIAADIDRTRRRIERDHHAVNTIASCAIEAERKVALCLNGLW